MKRTLLSALAFSALVATMSGSAAPASIGSAEPSKLTAGTGTIYFASYGKRLVAVDEATEKVAGGVPLTTGLAWSMRLSHDATRFYVQSADQEHFETIDIAARRTIDTFTLGTPDVHVRALAFDVDPQNRFMVVVARTAKKLIDRFEIEDPVFIQYDLAAHKVVRTVPWTTDPEPRYYYLNIKFSPDGHWLYVFADKIHIYDASTLEKKDSWDLSLPNESGLARFDMGSMDQTNDEPGFFTALFTTSDPIQHRRQLVLGRIDLSQKRVDWFEVSPAPDYPEVTFALGADRKFGYVLLEDIRRYEFWTVDLAGKRLQSRVPFESRPRMALRSSTNGKIIYIFEAGNTIDLYEAATFKYLRTITLDGDMMYNTFHVVPPRSPSR
jgi:hypothetical protein